MSNFYEAKFYDPSGHPITASEWMQAFANGERVVAHTTVGDVDVSTIWLGLDHRIGDGPPLIFETCIFSEMTSTVVDRYSTEEEAKKGHRRLVRGFKRLEQELRKRKE